MKKILFMVAAMATLISCGGSHDKFYFDEAENRAFNNPEAELDSLSYAYGIEMALPFYTQLADFGFQRDYFIELVEGYLASDMKSFPDIDIVNAEFAKFETESIRPYMIAKQRRMFDPNAEGELPALYNEKYTPEMFNKWMSAMATNMVVSAAAPVNIHYVIEGIKATEAIVGSQPEGNVTRLDSVAQANLKVLRAHISNYYTKELPKYHMERTQKWMAEVAKKPDVQPLVIGNDTIYYRINNPGGVKTSSPTDSIALSYNIYTYRGKLLQSTNDQVKQLENRIKSIKENKEMADSARYAQIRQGEELIANIKKHIAPVNTIRLEVIKHCLPLVGEFGSITVWAPTKYAPPSRQMMPNEGVVVDFEIKRIAKGIDVSTFLKNNSKQTVKPSQLPNKVTIEPGKKAEGAAPVKVVPVKK